MGDGRDMGVFLTVCVVGRLWACFWADFGCVHWQIRNPNEKWHRTHPSGASVTNCSGLSRARVVQALNA
eukprot:8828531-Alexandrium_andersonii.AAC.1